ELHVTIVKDQGREEFQYGFYIDGGKIPKYGRQAKGANNPGAGLHKLAVYLGTAGLQAFYAILENFIRNSGKHSLALEKESVRKRSEAMIRLFSGSNVPAARQAAEENQPLKIFLEFAFDWSRHLDQDYVRISLYDD